MSDWIEWKWTPEKPYQETLDSWVVVMLANGHEAAEARVSFWHYDDSSWNPDTVDRPGEHITHYRIASDDKE